MYYYVRLCESGPSADSFAGLPAPKPRKLGAGSGTGGAGALPGRSRGRSVPGGRGRGPQSRAHRLYFQGTVKRASPDLRRRVCVCVCFFPATPPQRGRTAFSQHTQKHRHNNRLPACSPTHALRKALCAAASCRSRISHHQQWLA